MKTDSTSNKLRLSEALKALSKQSQNLTQSTVSPGTESAQRVGTDAVKSSVDQRLASAERTTGSGRSFDEIKESVQSGRYLKETNSNAVAEAVARELFS